MAAKRQIGDLVHVKGNPKLHGIVRARINTGRGLLYLVRWDSGVDERVPPEDLRKVRGT